MPCSMNWTTLRSGDTNATKANATAKLADAIISTVEMELTVHKTLAKHTANEPIPAVNLPSFALTDNG